MIFFSFENLTVILTDIHGKQAKAKIYAQESYCHFAVTKNIVYAKELVDKLISKSGDLDWKVEEIEGDVNTLKCGLDSLKEDVTALRVQDLNCRHNQ